VGSWEQFETIIKRVSQRLRRRLWIVGCLGGVLRIPIRVILLEVGLLYEIIYGAGNLLGAGESKCDIGILIINIGGSIRGKVPQI
jgi:hypothetical protein